VDFLVSQCDNIPLTHITDVDVKYVIHVPYVKTHSFSHDHVNGTIVTQLAILACCSSYIVKIYSLKIGSTFCELILSVLTSVAGSAPISVP
jgi:hypothetical protein